MTAKATTKTSAAKAEKHDNIYKKILQAQKQIDSVPKRGFNAFHKYHYATEADILTVKETLNNVGLVVLPTTVEQETGFRPDGKSWARVTLLFKVVDVDTGEVIESQFTGYAEDNNDKAIYKATTGANKYFYLKFFGIATEDDPEREDLPQKAPRQAQARKFATSPAEERAEKTPPDTRKTQALINANKILSLQKQYGLSNEEVLAFGEIQSVKALAEAGDTEKLAEAYNKLSDHVRTQLAI